METSNREDFTMNHTVSPTAEHVETILRQSKLDTEVADLSHRSFKRLLEQKERNFSPAGWHGASDIVTLNGLAGSYFWSENPLSPSHMSFSFDAGHQGNQGTYRLSTPLGSSQEGVFYCVPNNPAIGWSFISLMPNGGGDPIAFTVAGMLTDATWKIWIMLLNKIGTSGPVNSSFAAVRFL